MTTSQSSGTLVLGASGFLGPAVLEAAADGGGPLWAASRGVVARLAELTRAEAEPVAVDLAVPGEVGALVDRLRPARVFNLAAMAAPAACEEDPGRARRVNAEAPGELADGCRAVGARLVHVSTDLVFGRRPAPAGGFTEEAATEPIGVYGTTKAAGERAVLAADPSALVARLPLLYGDSRGRGLGASDGLLAALARGRFTLLEDEWRTPLEVRAAAEALVELAQGREAGLLHVAGPQRISRLELGRAVLAAAGGLARDLPEPAVATRAALGLERRAEDTALDTRRARALLATELPDVAGGLARWVADRSA